MKLAEEKCAPAKSGEKPLSIEESRKLRVQIPRWIIGDKEIEREFQFKDFRESMRFVNQVADLAEEQNHHPDICIFYSKVRLVLSTHKIGGLSRNDFILAAKIDLLA